MGLKLINFKMGSLFENFYKMPAKMYQQLNEKLFYSNTTWEAFMIAMRP
jgi:hypothetical protein